MTDTTQLPESVLPKNIHAKFVEESKKDGEAMKGASEFIGIPVSEQAVFQREQGYFMGAKTQYLRSLKLIQALERAIVFIEREINDRDDLELLTDLKAAIVHYSIQTP